MIGVVRRAASLRHRLPDGPYRVVERLKWSPARDVAAPAPGPDGPRPRLLLAPANFAGQGTAWARAFETAGLGTACSWAYATTAAHAFEADYRVPITVNCSTTRWQRRQFDAVVREYDAVVIEAGRPLFGRLFGFDPLAEAHALQSEGLAVALLWHGTDIRSLADNVAREAHSPYADETKRAQAAAIEASAIRNRRRGARFGGPQLVSTPDLLHDAPTAEWCPVVVRSQLERREPAKPLLSGGLPVVAHVPSNPWLKGTAEIEPILRRLESEGVLEYRPASGLTPERVLDAYDAADIVLDQFRMGIYGVAAGDAMAAGRVVVSHVSDFTREAVRDRTGFELPIVEATVETLEQTLRDLIEDPAGARAIAASGPIFATAVHSGARSTEVLAAALGLGPEPSRRR